MKDLKAVNIVFARNENSPDLTFVEIETDEGEGLRFGELLSETEYVKIRITPDDFKGEQK